MKDLKDIILEKILINKDTKVFNHNDRYFPYDCIGNENECVTIECKNNSSVDSMFNMIKFRKALMDIYKKCKYTAVLCSVNIEADEPKYAQITNIIKDGPVTFKICAIPNRDSIKNNGEDRDFRVMNFYKFIQQKISNSRYLNSSGWIYFIDTRLRVKKIHISWLSNKECIAINFEAEKY